MPFKNINYVCPDEALAVIVGKETEPFPQKLKKLWAYMKSHKLIEKRPNPDFHPKA